MHFLDLCGKILPTSLLKLHIFLGGTGMKTVEFRTHPLTISLIDISLKYNENEPFLVMDFYFNNCLYNQHYPLNSEIIKGFFEILNCTLFSDMSYKTISAIEYRTREQNDFSKWKLCGFGSPSECFFIHINGNGEVMTRNKFEKYITKLVS